MLVSGWSRPFVVAAPFVLAETEWLVLVGALVLEPGCFLFLEVVAAVGLAAKVEVPGIESFGICAVTDPDFVVPLMAEKPEKFDE